ncbi:molybdopterin-guanine dinucleotide biosynthesis protein B [Pelosinus baikalensis]|nr:molybdopterin-guanine dinucleotide biosynthesis protein B [Pelosinus baikalensis]
MIPLVSFVGYSNSGKTTLLTKVIRELKNRGYRIAVIKHDCHDFEIDHAGTDTWRHRQAGAEVVCIASAHQVAIVQTLTQPLALDDIIQGINNVDLILTEGFKQEEKPQIEVHRQGREYIGLKKNRIALVADQQIYTGVPYFKLEEVKEVTDFLENRIRLSKV